LFGLITQYLPPGLELRFRMAVLAGPITWRKLPASQKK
jgi:hypothetical protein